MFWEPGYDLCLPDMCGFDNQLKWRLDYTLQWIVEQWLPLLAKQRYAMALRSRGRLHRLFCRPMPYEDFARFYLRGMTPLGRVPDRQGAFYHPITFCVSQNLKITSCLIIPPAE